MLFTLYYVIFICFNLLLLLIFMKHTIYTSKHKLWWGIIIGGTNLSMTSYFISADPWSSLADSGHNKKRRGSNAFSVPLSFEFSFYHVDTVWVTIELGSIQTYKTHVFICCGNAAADISKPHTFKWGPLADDVLDDGQNAMENTRLFGLNGPFYYNTKTL